VSFQVLIMALLGGVHRLYGPVFGVIPLAMLFEILLARFPNHFSILVGIAFLLIVYAIPRGIVGLIEGAQLSLRRTKGAKA
jgi:branched-chain amino acid transport system permease protein